MLDSNTARNRESLVGHWDEIDTTGEGGDCTQNLKGGYNIQSISLVFKQLID